ncbi:class I SAM-dependent methyltransferase [Candidatus Pacearchaeota archaeon]|nr:class I SAM-dependent methyltransferase [Candidatus Pacearchaeota archaeon]
MAKEPTYTDIRKTYDGLAKIWDFVATPMEFLFGISRLRKQLMRRAHGEVLELAVGTGRNFNYYDKSCSITAVDLSPGMLKRAEQKAERLGLQVELGRGSAENLDFDDESFDCVTETLALCTYKDPIKALHEMQRVCKKDGYILLLEHGISDNSLIKRWQNWRELPHYEKMGCHLTRNPLKIVQDAGLNIKESKRTGIGKSLYLIVARA